ncbi:hypothetical protein FSARC_10951 [Fusarium sarcochroum]|uniref:Uncharacterized protein n=1 Tax=Fusarium sarcochroum TaxID=1208366 RepID=A0A8H4X2P4_9HYPO|nr:hypothetical protein FSARC_10951 [Fusarium sarcochroum]
MTDNLVRIRYCFSSIEEYESSNLSLREIIKADTGEEFWIETRSLPPIGYPPPLHAESVGKLKGLEGVQIAELKDD